MKKSLALMLAAIVALAGCVGGIGGLNSPSDSDARTGTVNLYISDRPNDIDDFRHLNVTITKVGFKKVDDGSMNESDNSSMNATDDESEESDERGADETEDEDGEWITRDVDNRTVDLTQLKGDNATLLSEFGLPNGTYEKVFVYIDEVNPTLKNNESTRVKLPSGKLHINSKFVVGNGEDVDFVFDISVHKAGKSGKYILKPVVSESGTDVPIDEVDDEEDEEEDDRDEDEKEDDEEENEEEDDRDEREDDEEENETENQINLDVQGNVSVGENVTVRATHNGSAVANATVKVNGEEVGETDSNGEIVVVVPEEEFEVEVELDDMEGELEIELDS